MDFRGKQLDLTVKPLPDTGATVSVGTDDEIDGFPIDYVGFLFAGDRGEDAAIEFIGKAAPARVRALVASALAANVPVRIDRTPIPRDKLERAFGLAPPDVRCA